MSKLAIIGTVEVAPGRRDEVLPLLMAHGARCLQDEPGTLRFEVMIPREDESRLLIFEVYRDDAAFEEHRDASSRARFQRESAGMVEKILVTRCSPADDGSTTAD